MAGAAYYNEIDAHAAQWLRELIRAGHIAPGEVDERDMWDVVPADLVRYSQWHFCAGIGVWSHALRQAGWPDDRQILTISLPCQSFSAAGKGAGFDDHRGQLAEAYFWMLDQLRPLVCIGEQVEAALRHDWLDVMATQMEARGYSVGAVSSPACGYGAPHIRQRLYWVADSRFRPGQRDTGSVFTAQAQRGSQGQHDGDLPIGHPDGCPARLVADAEHSERRAEHQEQRKAHGRDGSGRNGNAGILGDSEGQRLGKARTTGDRSEERTCMPGPTNGFWANAEWIPCRDGKARPTGRGIHPLVVADASKRVKRGIGAQHAIDGLQPDDRDLHGVEGEQQREEDGEGVTQPRFEQMAYGPAAGVVHSGDQGAPADEIDTQNTAEARVMRLRGYGNCIVASQAAAFIRAFIDQGQGRPLIDVKGGV